MLYLSTVFWEDCRKLLEDTIREWKAGSSKSKYYPNFPPSLAARVAQISLSRACFRGALIAYRNERLIERDFNPTTYTQLSVLRYLMHLSLDFRTQTVRWDEALFLILSCLYFNSNPYPYELSVLWPPCDFYSSNEREWFISPNVVIFVVRTLKYASTAGHSNTMFVSLIFECVVTFSQSASVSIAAWTRLKPRLEVKAG